MPLARACLAYPVLVCPLRSTGAAASASAARSPTAAQVRLQSADFCLVKQAIGDLCLVKQEGDLCLEQLTED